MMKASTMEALDVDACGRCIWHCSMIAIGVEVEVKAEATEVNDRIHGRLFQISILKRKSYSLILGIIQ
ncbi:hypothetical protein L2E82_12899 [Cichorium intybus]|uniref:Uncharacterized protein n=1 Tax=Cichorium intybus TaxID=13427 RepID=A0ACB9GI05_CICIN|nr:hypothetical protein L2E82_12899 [Cichorium intybus]